jgi:hypothetical protein
MDCDRKVTYLREDRTQSTSVSTIHRERVCTRMSQNSCGRCPPGVPASMLQRLPFRHNNTLTMHTTTCTGNGPYARISLCGILQHVLDAPSLSLSLSLSLYTLTIQLPLTFLARGVFTFGLCLETTQPGSYGAFSQQPIMYPSAYVGSFMREGWLGSPWHLGSWSAQTSDSSSTSCSTRQGRGFEISREYM